MGFYHGSSDPPPEKGKPGGFKEAMFITIAVFRALALPLGVIFGGMLGLVLLFWLFTLSGWAGLAAILAIVLGLAGYGFWEYRHPPEFE
ncbi:MAG: hypothetical protein WD557_18355 [Dehalococcoidia bacterium]